MELWGKREEHNTQRETQRKHNVRREDIQRTTKRLEMDSIVSMWGCGER